MISLCDDSPALTFAKLLQFVLFILIQISNCVKRMILSKRLVQILHEFNENAFQLFISFSEEKHQHLIKTIRQVLDWAWIDLDYFAFCWGMRICTAGHDHTQNYQKDTLEWN